MKTIPLHKDLYKIIVPEKYFLDTIQTFKNVNIKIVNHIKFNTQPCEIYIKCSKEIFEIAQNAVDEVVENNKLSTRITKIFNKSRDFLYSLSSDAFEFTASKIIKQHERTER